MEDLARLGIAAAWSRDQAQSLVAPGSFEEEAALERIDTLRRQERAEIDSGRSNAGSSERSI